MTQTYDPNRPPHSQGQRPAPQPMPAPPSHHILRLQQRYGNRAVMRYLQRRPASLQRVLWKFHTGAWVSADNHTPAPPAVVGNLPPTTTPTLNEGDLFNDATGRLHSSHGTTVNYGHGADTTAGNDALIKQGVAEAEMRLTQALEILTTAQNGAGALPGPVDTALTSTIPDIGTMGDPQKRVTAGMIAAALQPVLDGLAAGTTIEIVGAWKWYEKPFMPNFSEVGGWVATGESAKDRQGSDPVRQFDAPISITEPTVTNATRHQGMVMTIIHEATHKFIGTNDYGYSPLKDMPQMLEQQQQFAALSAAPNDVYDQMAQSTQTNITNRFGRPAQVGPYSFEQAGSNNLNNWYAMGLTRHLRNADSLAQLVMFLTHDVKVRR